MQTIGEFQNGLRHFERIPPSTNEKFTRAYSIFLQAIWNMEGTPH